MKIDLAGPRRRGLAMGINEFAGYAAVAAAAWGSAWLAAKYGVRPTPFYLGVLFVVLGLGLSVWPVRETRDLVDLARPNVDARSSAPAVPRNLLWHASFGRRDLNAIAQAGMVNNLNDGVVWGLIPFMLAARGHSLEAIGTLVAIYPAVWGLAQLPAGAWSDRVGRRPLIVVGMVLQSVALAMLLLWLTWLGVALSMVFLGLGTALVYPTLLAAIADATPPSWRGSAVGVYRLWRDGGYAVGALGGGAIADLYGSETAVGVAAGLTLASGLFVALRLRPPAPEPETQTEPDYSSAAAL